MARKNEEGGFKQAVVEFLEAEKSFLKHHEVCRVATSHNDTPHVTPVNFVFDDGLFYFAQITTQRSTETLRRIKGAPWWLTFTIPLWTTKPLSFKELWNSLKEERNFKSSTISFIKNLTGLEKSHGRKERRRL
jgi:hypothetical protein